MIFKFILFVFIGAFIGYITNYLAIKMLFRPYRKVYLFNKIPLPFTPGVIPKERENISEAIAETLEKYILTEEKLKEILEKTDYRTTLKKSIENSLDEIIDNFVNDFKRILSEGLSIGKFNIKTAFIMTALDKAITKGLDKIKPKLKEKILEKIYTTVEENLDREVNEIVKRADIKNSVKETLLSIDIKDLEFIILGITEKQLKHITYFGAIIGALIGVIQFVISIFLE
ncbi:MAG: DUF445 domain-containing protein [Persephonella sp.]|nr:MAG: DUF445 domain-containing protein [Persephonella sp.]